MYIASKSQKNSSNYTRFFAADVVFFRQTGRKLANSGKNGGNSAKKQFANQINFHLYHYAGNNPVKYVDPDGKKLTLYVDKKTQTMSVKMDITICGANISINEKYKITTHVVGNDSPQNKTSNENLDPKKRNSNGSAWTQFPNGTWNITECIETPKQNIDTYAEEQLRTDAHQTLPVRIDGEETIKTDKNGNPVLTDDSGYNIHFTTHTNTAGCIGVKDKIQMKFLIYLYKLNERFDPKSSRITVTGSEE